MELIIVKIKVFIIHNKVVGGDVGYCLGDDVEVGASGNHHPTIPQQPLSTLLSQPASDLTPNSTPDHVLVHLGDLPGDLLLLLEDLVVLHLVHLHVHHHLNR